MKLLKSLRRKICKITPFAFFVVMTMFVFTCAAMAQTSGGSGLEIQQIVSAADVKSELYTAVTPWIKGGLSVAVTIFLVRIGWRLIKSFTNRG